MSDDDNFFFMPTSIQLKLGFNIADIFQYGSGGAPPEPTISDPRILDWYNNQIRLIINDKIQLNPLKTPGFYSGQLSVEGSFGQFMGVGRETGVLGAIQNSEGATRYQFIDQTPQGQALAQTLANLRAILINETSTATISLSEGAIIEIETAIRSYRLSELIVNINSGSGGIYGEIGNNTNAMRAISQLSEFDYAGNYAWKKASYNMGIAANEINGGRSAVFLGDFMRIGNAYAGVELRVLLEFAGTGAVNGVDHDVLRTIVARESASPTQGYEEATDFLRTIQNEAAEWGRQRPEIYDGIANLENARILSEAAGWAASDFIKAGGSVADVPGHLRGEVPYPEGAPRLAGPISTELMDRVRAGVATHAEFVEFHRAVLAELTSLDLANLRAVGTSEVLRAGDGIIRGLGGTAMLPLAGIDTALRAIHGYNEGGAEGAAIAMLEAIAEFGLSTAAVGLIAALVGAYLGQELQWALLLALSLLALP